VALPVVPVDGEEEREFIRDTGSGPSRAGLKAEIWCYDHNFT